jgi:hypothetical protein
MSRYTMIVRTLVGAACALLVTCYLAAPASAGSKFSASLVPPPTTYDANNATLYGSGIVAPAIPDETKAPGVIGLNICASAGGTTDNTCGGFCPGNCNVTTCTAGVCKFTCSGVPCTPPGYCTSVSLTCPGGYLNGCPCTSNGDCPAGVCSLTVNGAHGTCDNGSYCAPTGAPDGVKSTDAKLTSASIDPQKSSCSIKGTQLQFGVTFDDAGLATPLGAKTGKGVCQGGQVQCVSGVCTKASKGTVCTSDSDCLCAKDSDCGKTTDGVKGDCVDGNEYIATLHAIMGTSPTTSCTKNHCILALGVVGGGTATGCAAGMCVGGLRNGMVCQNESDCPLGGACDTNDAGAPITLPTLGASFALAGGAGTVTPLCPFEFNLSAPMDVAKGKGKSKQDLTKTSLGAVLASGTNVDILSCEIREPYPLGTSGISQLGLFTGTAAAGAGSNKGRPEAQLIMPLPPGSTAPANVGVGAIIGISGGAQK